jgi:transcriptional regulator with XRE-family HTH domain
MNQTASVGENIARLRSERSWSQEQLARAAGVSSVAMIEAGHRAGRISTLRQIADALEVPLSSLFDHAPPTPIVPEGEGQGSPDREGGAE